MHAYLKAWRRLETDRRGVTALEYGLIAALIAGVIIGGVTLVGTNLNTKFSAIAAAVGTTAS